MKIERLFIARADHLRGLESERIIQLADQAKLESEAVSPVESALCGRWSYPQKMVALSCPSARCL